MKTKAKFKIGQIVRYSYGPTALMKITTIMLDHGGIGSVRYYGRQYYGDSEGRYETQLTEATPEEIHKFKTDPHIGRLRDYPELAE